jgi:hypothetical protein
LSRHAVDNQRRRDFARRGAGPLTDAVKRLGALDQQPTTEPQSSIEIARSSKGQKQWTVKCYAHDAVSASELAQALYDDLAARYGQQAETSV